MPESLNDAILTTWFEYQGDLQCVIDKHQLTAAQIRDFADDPMVRKTLDDYEGLLARRQRIHAMSHQHNAAEMLSKSMFEAGTNIECRRAATALARLTRDMLRRNSSPAPGGEGGRVFEAGGGASGPGATSDPPRSDVPPPPPTSQMEPKPPDLQRPNSPPKTDGAVEWFVGTEDQNSPRTSSAANRVIGTGRGHPAPPTSQPSAPATQTASNTHPPP